MQKIKLIIGLGNPGAEYENTFHNVGHLFIDFIKIKDLGLKIKEILKTEVFMNKSGEFVKEQVKKNKIKPEQLLIVHDDSDIELGKYKLSFNRSSAGHRGVQNIMNQLKTEAFWRLRIGIRPHSALKSSPSKPRLTADQLVLKKISPAHKKKLEEVFKEILKNKIIS